MSHMEFLECKLCGMDMVQDSSICLVRCKIKCHICVGVLSNHLKFLPPSSPNASNLSQHQGLFQYQRIFQMSQLFTSGDQSIRASASTSVFPMNIQDWFPLKLTDLISLLSKGFSRVFSNTTVLKHQFSGLSFLYDPTRTSIRDYWKKHNFYYMGICWPSNVTFLIHCLDWS